MIPAPTRRPTEYASALALLTALYGFLTQAGISHPVAALIALAVAFLPFAVSAIVDAMRLTHLHVGDLTDEPNVELPEDETIHDPPASP